MIFILMLDNSNLSQAILKHFRNKILFFDVLRPYVTMDRLKECEDPLSKADYDTQLSFRN